MYRLYGLVKRHYNSHDSFPFSIFVCIFLLLRTLSEKPSVMLHVLQVVLGTRWLVWDCIPWGERMSCFSFAQWCGTGSQDPSSLFSLADLILSRETFGNIKYIYLGKILLFFFGFEVQSKSSLKNKQTQTNKKPTRKLDCENQFENHWHGRMPCNESGALQVNLCYYWLWNYCPNSPGELPSFCSQWQWRNLLVWGVGAVIELLCFPECMCHVASLHRFSWCSEALRSLKKLFVCQHHTRKYPLERVNMSLSHDRKSLGFSFWFFRNNCMNCTKACIS